MAAAELLPRLNPQHGWLVAVATCLADELAGPRVEFVAVTGVDSGANPTPGFSLGNVCLVATCKDPSDLGSLTLLLPAGVGVSGEYWSGGLVWRKVTQRLPITLPLDLTSCQDSPLLGVL